MANKKDQYYFQQFVQQVDYSCQSAQLLLDSFCAFDPQKLKDQMEQMHHLEHSADMAKHDMMNRLVREFITPIEREDIIELAQNLDEVTDHIEDVLLRAYMFHIETLPPQAKDLCQVVLDCCKALKRAMEEFHDFRKSTVVRDSIVEINRLEEEGDRIYTEATRSVFTDPGLSPSHQIGYSDILHCLERCCDDCEHVADVMEGVIMKNT